VRWRIPGESKLQVVTVAPERHADALALYNALEVRAHTHSLPRATDPDVRDWSIVTGKKVEPRVDVLTFRAALTRWLGKSTGNEHTRARGLRKTEQHLASWLDRDVSTITEDDVADLVATMRAAGLKDSTIHNVLVPARATFLSLHARGKIPTDPFGVEPIKLNHAPKKRRYLTRDEFHVYVAAAPERVRPMLLLAVDAGLRANELLALQVRHVALGDSPIVEVEQSFSRTSTDHRRQLTTPKARSFGALPISRTTADALEPLLVDEFGRPRAEDEFLFLRENGSPWSYGAFARVIRLTTDTLIAEQKMSRRVAAHDFRHTCGVWMIQAGLPLHRVQERLRHKSILVTRREYLAVLPTGDEQVRSVLADVFDAPSPRARHLRSVS